MTHDTVLSECGGWRYRILDEGGSAVLSSGVFNTRNDAERVGRHWASDPELPHFLKD